MMSAGALKTARLRLRPFQSADLKLLVALDGDPEVMRYLTGGALTPVEHLETELLQRFLSQSPSADGLGAWVAESRTEAEPLGWLTLLRRGAPLDREAELGYRFRRVSWGQGFATEAASAVLDLAFSTAELQRITASTYEDNLASLRVMEKLGMRHIRTFRITSVDQLAGATYHSPSLVLFDGSDVEYAITRTEWMSRPQDHRRP